MTASEGQQCVIQVFSRPGCHLCEILLEELMPLIRSRLQLEVCNINNSAAWIEKYGLRIPVVVFNGQEICHFKLDKSAIASIVDAHCPAIKAS